MNEYVDEKKALHRFIQRKIEVKEMKKSRRKKTNTKKNETKGRKKLPKEK